jgi:malate synthase A
MSKRPPRGIVVGGAPKWRASPILSAPAIEFVADLARAHRPTITKLLARRAERAKEMDALAAAGKPIIDFLESTRTVRDTEWVCATIPTDLRDRRVEITGPVDRKMVINALNSGARVFMADFEDSTTPTWENLIDHLRASRQALRAQREDRRAHGAPAGAASARGALRGGWRADPRCIAGLRPLLLP